MAAEYSSANKRISAELRTHTKALAEQLSAEFPGVYFEPSGSSIRLTYIDAEWLLSQMKKRKE